MQQNAFVMLNRIFLLFCIILLTTSYSYAQEFGWMYSTGSASNFNSQSLAADKLGNLYVIGGFYSNSTFEGNELKWSGDEDFFVAKYTISGNLKWVKSFGGPAQDNALSISCDLVGNIYVTGYFEKSCLFGSIELETTKDNQDFFIMKLNPSGEVQWAEHAGNYNQSWSKSVGTDSKQNVFIGGFIGANTTFGDTTVKTNRSMFLAKYDKNGGFNHVITGNGYSDLNALCLDNENNIFITGHYENHLDLGLQVLDKNTRSFNFFLAKMDSAGNCKWLFGLNHASTSFGTSVKVDQSGNLCFVYMFYDSTTIEGVTYYSHGDYDLVLGKFTNDGKLLWHKRIGGSNMWNDKTLTTDNNDNIYLTGTLVDKEVFDDSVYYANKEDVFIAKFDRYGNMIWLKHGKGDYQDKGQGIVYNNNSDALYCTGHFINHLSFDNQDINTLGNDFYLCEIMLNKREVTLDNQFKIYPNPTSENIHVIGMPTYIKEIDIVAPKGDVVKTVKVNAKEVNIDIRDLSAGIYYVRIHHENGVEVKKIIIY